MVESSEKRSGLIETLLKLGIPLSQLILVGSIGAVYGYRLEWGREHKLLIFLLAVLYELLVLVVAFVKKLWEKELEQDALKATADWVRALPVRFAPGFRRRYLRQAIIDHEIFNVRGLGLIAAHTLKLDQVFVELKISTTSNPQQFNYDPVTARALAGSRSVWEFVRASEDQAGDAIALAVIGPPGCGKTTLLQHVAVTLASNRQRRYHLRAYTPMLLFLRHHAATIEAQPAITLADLAQQYFSTERDSKLKTPPRWFERQLERGRCLVLLDGLDEVADAARRRVMSEWVDAQLKNYPKCRFVITSRPQGYRDAPLQRAHVAEVQPFSGDQVTRFIKSWYLANEVVSSGNQLDEGVRQRASRDAEDLLKRLRDPKASALSAITVNPLLLTMIAMVHRYRGALPGSRVELYREICEVLLGRWRQARGVEETLTADQKRVVLMPLAAEMMEREAREITAADALAIIKKPLRRVGVTGEAVKNFLNDLQTSSGLLLERESGRWSFAHLTFQEYLTAAYWLAEKKTPESWSALVENSWWHETLRLYAAQGDATPIMQACLDVGSVPAITLAAEILEEGYREVSDEVRLAVEARVTAALESTDAALRRLAAEVRLFRRLKKLYPIDERRAIDQTYLTCAEYQLFLDEMRRQGKSHQPDHWTDFSFPGGQADKAVCGVRAEDAEAFCDWLTKRQGGSVRYRLLRPDEAGEHQAESTELGAWCQDESGFSLTKLTETSERKIKQQFPQFSSASEAVRVPSLDLDRAQNRALALALTRDCDPLTTCSLAFDLTFELAFAFLIIRNRARAVVLAHALGFGFARDLARDLDLACALIRDFDLILDLARGLERARALTRDLDLTLARDLARVYARITKRQWIFSSSQRDELLELLQAAATTTTDAQTWQAQRQFAAKMLEYVYPPDQTVAETAAPPVWRRWLRWRKGERTTTPLSEEEDNNSSVGGRGQQLLCRRNGCRLTGGCRS